MSRDRKAYLATYLSNRNYKHLPGRLSVDDVQDLMDATVCCSYCGRNFSEGPVENRTVNKVLVHKYPDSNHIDDVHFICRTCLHIKRDKTHEWMLEKVRLMKEAEALGKRYCRHCDDMFDQSHFFSNNMCKKASSKSSLSSYYRHKQSTKSACR